MTLKTMGTATCAATTGGAVARAAGVDGAFAAGVGVGVAVEVAVACATVVEGIGVVIDRQT